MDHRVTVARRALMAARPFLSSHAIPVAVRAKVLKCMIMPVALYGGEIWGMRQDFVNELQCKVMNPAVRWMYGLGAGSSLLPLRAALVEFSEFLLVGVGIKR